jgi:hypothetical protein
MDARHNGLVTPKCYALQCRDVQIKRSSLKPGFRDYLARKCFAI